MIKKAIHKTGLAVCYDCGEELIAPADGKAYWCISCSQRRDEKDECDAP